MFIQYFSLGYRGVGGGESLNLASLSSGHVSNAKLSQICGRLAGTIQNSFIAVHHLFKLK